MCTRTRESSNSTGTILRWHGAPATGAADSHLADSARLASLTWQPNASRETNTAIELLVTEAVGFNTRYADGYAWLGEVRAYLGNPDAIGLIRRAISIEPMDARHRLRAAGVLLRQGKPAEARVEAQAALTLADTDEERRSAERLLEAASKAAAK